MEISLPHIFAFSCLLCGFWGAFTSVDHKPKEEGRRLYKYYECCVNCASQLVWVNRRFHCGDIIRVVGSACTDQLTTKDMLSPFSLSSWSTRHT